MRVVSLNAWGGALFDSLRDWIPSSGADVLCLQEVTRTPGLAGWTRFVDRERSLPQRADLFADVAALLPGHQALFLASDAGPVFAGGQRYRQDFGLGLFVDERYPVVDRQSRFIHGAFADHEEWPASDRPRNGQAVRIFDRTAQRFLTIVHAHGLRNEAGKGDTPDRRAQAQRLVELVQLASESSDLAVLCGDLNLLPDSETFDRLREIGLVDLVGRADTRTSHYPKPVRHASYLLISEPSAVRRFEILEQPEVSDHCALVLDL